MTLSSYRTSARPIRTDPISTPGTEASALLTAWRQWPQLMPSMNNVRSRMTSFRWVPQGA